MREDSLKRLLLGQKTPTKNGTPVACGKRSLQASRTKF